MIETHTPNDSIYVHSEAPLLISVVICTHNRADYLPRAIDSVAKQSMSNRKYEIIVVDNCSADRTREVVRHFETTAKVRYIFEHSLGLCHARNTGWKNAQGCYVAYLDDDAIASPGWLAAIEEAFAIAPEAGVVGGRVDPIWEGERPEWLSDDIALGLTIVDWSKSPKVIPDVSLEWLVGANMAVRAAVLAEVGGFHPKLDRVGKRMLSSGDVFLQKEILKRGYCCVYHPEIAVRHLVPESRLEKRWFVRRYFTQGLSDAVMQLIEEDPSSIECMQLAMLKGLSLLRRPGKVLSLIWAGNDAEKFTEKCFTLIKVGHILGLLRAVGR